MDQKKRIINMLRWIMNNKRINDELTWLLNKFISSDSNIAIIYDENNISTVKIIKEDRSTLEIVFSPNLNNIKITFTHNNGNSILYKNIKRNYEQIEVIEKETDITELKSKNTEKTTTSKYSKYINNLLVNSTYEKTFKSSENAEKSYSINEEMYVMPNKSAFLKRKVESKKNPTYKTETLYLDTETLTDVSFNNISDYVIETEFYNISTEEKYNDFMAKYRISLLPICCINIKYLTQQNEIRDAIGVLLYADNKIIEILIDKEPIKITYDNIKSISTNEQIIYDSNIKKDKCINLKKDD